MTDDEALSLFIEGDDPDANVAFERLRARTADGLLARVSSSLRNREDAEDVVQQVYVRVWNRRLKLVDMGFAAFRGYLNRVALRCSLDFVRGHQPAVPLDSIQDVPSDERPLVSAVEDTARLGLVFQTADEVWLGLNASVSPADRSRQLAAAQMMAIDGVPWDIVRRILGDQPDGSGPLDRPTIDRWLLEPSVVCLLAYNRLYFANAALAAHLLGADRSGGASAAGTASPGDGTGVQEGAWTEDEARVILWRFGSAMSMQQITARGDCGLTREQLDDIVAKCVALFPFMDRMAEMLASPALRVSGRLRDYLASDGLWKRLVFQYAYVDDLSYKDILDRTAPAADQVGCTITERGTLKGWIAMKRLLAELAVACRERMGVDSDD